MRWNQGVTRWARLANSPLAEPPLYSKSPIPSLTPNVIVDGWLATPRRARRRSKFG